MIGIDTFSWTKIFSLVDDSWKEIMYEWLNSIDFFITKEVEIELKHFHNTRDPIWERGAVLSNINVKFQYFEKLGFDRADISLLEYSEKPDYIICTEDRPMLLLNVYNKNNIIQLIDLFKMSYINGFFTKKEFIALVKWFREFKNITIKKANKII
jgi:hypothetical protein